MGGENIRRSSGDGAFSGTGVPNLDTVLGGGLPPAALALIVGPPGSGKTTLANQIAFAAAHTGRRVAVVSAISEPTSKLIAHLRTFAFYDDALVGDRVQFLSLEHYLSEGLAAAGDALIGMARQTRADVAVLDGFRGVRGVDVDLQASRQFLYDVGSTLSTLGVTTIITSEADPRDPAFFPESTTADVIVGLHYSLIGVQQQRALEVIKMRGAEPLPGLHSISLSGSGLTVYPRLETRMATPPDAVEPSDAALAEVERQFAATTAGDAGTDTEMDEGVHAAGESDAVAAFGIPALDLLLGGGLPAGTSTLLVGSLGTGKTILALHFAVAGLRAGESTVYLGFREGLPQLVRKARPFTLGRDLLTGLGQRDVSSGALVLQHWASVELQPDVVADRLIEALDRVGARRLVVDSVAELEHALIERGQATRIESYLGAILEAVRRRGVTALFIREHVQTVTTRLQLTAGPVAVLAENIMLLQRVEDGDELRRVLTILKMRFTSHDAGLYEFAIEAPEGIRLVGAYHRTRGRVRRDHDPSEAATSGETTSMHE